MSKQIEANREALLIHAEGSGESSKWAMGADKLCLRCWGPSPAYPHQGATDNSCSHTSARSYLRVYPVYLRLFAGCSRNPGLVLEAASTADVLDLGAPGAAFTEPRGCGLSRGPFWRKAPGAASTTVRTDRMRCVGSVYMTKREHRYQGGGVENVGNFHCKLHGR